MAKPGSPLEREPEPFEGFGPHLLDFYERLEVDNTREFWLANKPVYDAEVARPLRALAEELAPKFGQPKVFRPHRDVRFSKDKTPYQTHASMGFFGGKLGNLYFQISASGMFIAGGLYEPARDQLEKFRDLQDDPKTITSLDALLPQLAKAGFPLDEGAPLKTAPRGRSVDHPRIELLRRTVLTVSHSYEPEPWFFSRELLDQVSAGFETVARWNAWLDTYVGPSQLPERAW